MVAQILNLFSTIFFYKQLRIFVSTDFRQIPVKYSLPTTVQYIFTFCLYKSIRKLSRNQLYFLSELMGVAKQPIFVQYSVAQGKLLMQVIWSVLGCLIFGKNPVLLLINELVINKKSCIMPLCAGDQHLGGLGASPHMGFWIWELLNTWKVHFQHWRVRF